MKLVKLLAVVATLSVAVPAWARVIDHQRFSGKGAEVQFEAFTPVTCADGTIQSQELFVVVFANESKTSSKSGGSNLTNSVTGIFSTFDPCTFTFNFASGTLNGGFVSKSPTSATVTGNIPLTDQNGAAAGTLSVSLSLTGSQSLQRVTEHSRTNFPQGTVIEQEIIESRRYAKASGSVTLNGQQLISSVVYSTIADSKVGTLDLSL